MDRNSSLSSGTFVSSGVLLSQEKSLGKDTNCNFESVHESKQKAVKDVFTIIETMSKGEENMHFGEINMNVRTIRLHTIFRMVIESKGTDSNSSDDSSNDIIRVSVLNLVYLAGSERIAKTGADGVRLKEGKYINKSLMILGDVINKLSDGSKKKGHIPYCDSKLTRILKPALGGNANTSIIYTVALEEQGPKGTLEVIMCGTVSCNDSRVDSEK
ncbi:hypothetical protein RYX36_014597, partial [Vicia faba]